jgi:hypothetical protein
VRLATPETAHLIEELVAYTDPPAPTVSSLRESTVAAALARARTCYDHLAGAFGVRLKQAMEEENVLSGLAVTPHGEQWFSGLGISLVPQGRRPIVRECLDWTERQPHLAGLAGSALCGRFFELGWIERIGSGRAIRVTSAGERGLANVLRASL